MLPFRVPCVVFLLPVGVGPTGHQLAPTLLGPSPSDGGLHQTMTYYMHEAVIVLFCLGVWATLIGFKGIFLLLPENKLQFGSTLACLDAETEIAPLVYLY